MTRTEVTRTYLEMTSARQLRRPTREPDPRVRVERAVRCTPSFYRYLYGEVGGAYHWRDRLGWGDDQIRDRLERDGVTVWVMYLEGTPAGYFELEEHVGDESAEIVYFGLLPEFVGRGLGKQLLVTAVELAWGTGARRVWLHTCTLDNPAALPNYIARGFVPFREERYVVELGEDD